MKVNLIHQVFFSATGSTEFLVDAVAGMLGEKGERYDLLRSPIQEETVIPSDHLLVVGMPVFSGRIPALCLPSLSQLRGNGTPAIVLVTYGNRNYDDALLELKDTMEAGGFVVVGAGAFVSQHSVFPGVGVGRPDSQDQAAVLDFANRSAAWLEAWDGQSPVFLAVNGNTPYKTPGVVQIRPSGDEDCEGCGTCVKICPTNAIPKETPTLNDVTLCISCAACVAACPTRSRRFRGMAYKSAATTFAKKFSARREPEVFFPTP